MFCILDITSVLISVGTLFVTTKKSDKVYSPKKRIYGFGLFLLGIRRQEISSERKNAMNNSNIDTANKTQNNNHSKISALVEGAVMVALAAVLSYIRVFHLPWGGSVTLLSMLPIAIYSIKHGVVNGLFAAFVFSLIQLGQGAVDGLFGWGLTPVMLIACIMLDYILPFTVLGLSGMFRKKSTVGWITGTAVAVILRFVMHFLSGVVIWHSVGKLWEDFITDNEYLYSLCYNGAYMLPELIFTLAGAVALFKIPQTRKLIIGTK